MAWWHEKKYDIPLAWAEFIRRTAPVTTLAMRDKEAAGFEYELTRRLAYRRMRRSVERGRANIKCAAMRARARAEYTAAKNTAAREMRQKIETVQAWKLAEYNRVMAEVFGTN